MFCTKQMKGCCYMCLAAATFVLPLLYVSRICYMCPTAATCVPPMLRVSRRCYMRPADATCVPALLHVSRRCYMRPAILHASRRCYMRPAVTNNLKSYHFLNQHQKTNKTCVCVSITTPVLSLIIISTLQRLHLVK